MLAACVAGILCLAAFFWWTARTNPKTNFLASESPALWIQYPEVPTGMLHPAIEISATFHRSFVLQNLPKSAKLSIRAMKRWELAVNGSPAGSSPALDQWKHATEVDVRAQLHPGTNEIVATVFNTNGPPALWLALNMDGQQLNSDSNWTARLLDSVECPAKLATTPPAINPGNWLLGKETPLEGFRHHPLFFLGTILAAVLLLSALWQLKRRRSDFVASPDFAVCAIGLMALLWVALYWNNLPALGHRDGFDSQDHLDYIQRIRTGHGLPLANEGWQMYQPPLYYLISSFVVGILGPETIHGTFTIVRILGLCIGIIHITLIFLSLRLLFPGRTGPPLFGLFLAALLPAHLYISQYVTNEALAAMLVTACFYLCLRIIIEKLDSRRVFAGVGLCLGAALLAKVTAVLAVPFVAAALFDPAILRESSKVKPWAARMLWAAGACLLVCGHYYYSVWSHFGSPFVGNWDAAVWPAWWMEPGFQSASYFLRFGRCLTHPWFSGFSSFGDGVYSTLWADGLLGGRIAVGHRPPWNYEIMAAGFILALVPSVFVATGAITAVKNFLQQPTRIWLLLIGLPLATLSALVYMNIKVPTYGEAKAFYGLIALLPLCALGALGYAAGRRLGKPLVSIALVAMGVWGINSYASFWIRTNSPETQIHLAIEGVEGAHFTEALDHYAQAVRLAPHDIELKALMVVELAAAGRTADVQQIAAQAMLDPLPDGDSHRYLAQILSLNGKSDAAVAEGRKSLENAPDSRVAYGGLAACLYDTGDYAETLSVGRGGERTDLFSAALHYYMGRSFECLGDQTNAVMHYRLAVLLDPSVPEMKDRFGLCLLTLHQCDEATNQFYKALQLRPGNPAFRYHLAAAFASQGQTVREIELYRGILQADRKFVPALASLAWRLATSPDDGLRDGNQALELASKACELTRTNDVRCLETLAAAYACVQNFGDATRTTEQAIEIATRARQPAVVTANQKRLALYQSGKAYVDDSPANAPIPPGAVIEQAEK